ncbi:hypothetical protein HNQ51_000242 [Inhella inkyongensis]|uniref:Uncharacterized protein n=1 Tax=Inhella inkyongensis TaxID=392593 RepID=A0A840S328_9BURK|nr:hypothetical protein [Inhella inkyongensis]MBB5202949.1 hypothetical protein [Inhella inkyongensis]
MNHLSHLLREQSLAALLRELRLLRGQPWYRYCMAWLIVAAHSSARVGLLWFVVQQVISKK